MHVYNIIFIFELQQFIIKIQNLQIDTKETNPQSCMFSATMPKWVYQTAKKYMRDSLKRVDLIGQQQIRTAETVEVSDYHNYTDRIVIAF